MLARAPPWPCSTAGAEQSTTTWGPVVGGGGLARVAARRTGQGPRAGVRLVVARPGRMTTMVVLGPEPATAEAANGSAVAGTVLVAACS